MTLRDLAFKTGKSTGVLDQAMKKLLKKKIVVREQINGTPKYLLHSLGTVSKWLQADTENKKRTLEMRHQNFEAFIASITAGKRRPEMQFFEGEEGMKKAYTLLLEKGNDFVQYGPTLYTEMEDPLREFRVQYFRERRKRNIFLRVITHNTPLGRRGVSRDPFEYRKTILVDENSYPFSFEKIIVGNTVACFHLETMEACFIEYKELAERERQFFEKLWNVKISEPPKKFEDNQIIINVAKDSSAFKAKNEIIPVKTKFLSEVREFFLSKRSIITFAICATVSIVLTYFIHQYNFSTQLKALHKEAESIVSNAALQFDYSDFIELKAPEDANRLEYSKVVYLLNEVRRKNAKIKFAYILRPTNKEGIWEFIANADSVNPFMKKDLNEDGKIDAADHFSLPGDAYRSGVENPYYIKAMTGQISTVSHTILGQWNSFVLSVAPIKDSGGEVRAVLAIDLASTSADIFKDSALDLFLRFILLFTVFILIRLAAFNKPLLSIVFSSLNKKYLIGNSILLLMVCAIFYYNFQNFSFNLIKEQVGKRLMAIAVTAASNIDGKDLQNLRFAKDMQTSEYQRIFIKLNDIRNKNPDISYAFIVRATSEENMWEFVADADSNFYIPFSGIDYNNDNKVDETDENVAPGIKYFDDTDPLKIATREPTYDREILYDQWGPGLAGYAPITDENGNLYGVLVINVPLKNLSY